MRLEAPEPPPGKTFRLRIHDREPLNRGLLLVGALLGAALVALLLLGTPSPAGLTAATQDRLEALVTVLQLGLGISCGVVVALCLFEARERTLEILGEPSGALVVEGAGLSETPRRFPAEAGPYSVALVRKIADDVAMANVDVEQQHLFASAQDDSSADLALRGFLRIDLTVVDAKGNRHGLLRSRSLLPDDTKDVFQTLQRASGGRFERLKGGGYVLRLPHREGEG